MRHSGGYAGWRRNIPAPALRDMEKCGIFGRTASDVWADSIDGNFREGDIIRIPGPVYIVNTAETDPAGMQEEDEIVEVRNHLYLAVGEYT